MRIKRGVDGRCNISLQLQAGDETCMRSSCQQSQLHHACSHLFHVGCAIPMSAPDANHSPRIRQQRASSSTRSSTHTCPLTEVHVGSGIQEGRVGHASNKAACWVFRGGLGRQLATSNLFNHLSPIISMREDARSCLLPKIARLHQGTIFLHLLSEHPFVDNLGRVSKTKARKYLEAAMPFKSRQYKIRTIAFESDFLTNTGKN